MTEPGERLATDDPTWFEDLRGLARPHALLLCGLPGSGKTVLAHRLERELPALRFNIDEWMIALFGHHMQRPVFDERFATLEKLAWDTARRTLALGTSVVLDYGFWSRSARLETARRVRAAGATPVVLYLEVPQAELARRLGERNATLPGGTYEITPEMLATFGARFEAPSEEEGMRLIRP